MELRCHKQLYGQRSTTRSCRSKQLQSVHCDVRKPKPCTCAATKHETDATLAPTRRQFMLLGAVSATTLLSPTASTAAEALCGVVDVIPSWAYTVPWSEGLLPNVNVWARVVGYPPSKGFLGFGKQGDGRCANMNRLYQKKTPIKGEGISNMDFHTHEYLVCSKLPLLCVHGGPGLSSKYLESLEILCAADRRVAFYDQAGCGRTLDLRQQLPQTTSLLDFYVAELSQLPKALAFERYHVFGEGWGGMLAATAVAAGKLPGAVSMTLVNTPERYESLIQDRRNRVEQLPRQVAAKLLADDTGDGSLFSSASPEFKSYVNSVLCHRAGAGCLTLSLQGATASVQQQLCGGYMFKAAGELQNWQIPGGISLPTLLMRGADGELSQAALDDTANRIPGSKAITIEKAGSCVHIDQSELFLTLLDEHLNNTEAALA